MGICRQGGSLFITYPVIYALPCNKCDSCSSWLLYSDSDSDEDDDVDESFEESESDDDEDEEEEDDDEEEDEGEAFRFLCLDPWLPSWDLASISPSFLFSCFVRLVLCTYVRLPLHS